METKINIMHLRVVKGTGGGPEKTILLSAETIDKKRFNMLIVYIAHHKDLSYAITEKVKGKEINFIQLWENFRFDIGPVLKLINIVKKYSIHIIHSHDYKSDVLAWLVRLATHVKIISTVHGWIGNSFKERMYNMIDRFVLRRFDRIIVVDEHIRDMLLRGKVRPSKIVKVHNAIDYDEYKRDPTAGDVRGELNIDESMPVIGFVGRLSPEKDLPVLFMAMKRLLAGMPDVRCIIVGDGPIRNWLEDYCKKVGIGEYVKFLGLRWDTKRLYQTMNVFVLPSKTEGIPNAVLEAMAMEVPVIATDIGGVGEIIDHNEDGILINPGDVGSLEFYLKKVLTDKEYREMLVTNARKKIIRNFSFLGRMQKVEKIYYKALGMG